MGYPRGVLAPNAERAPPLLGEDRVGLAQWDGFGFGPPPLGEIPEPLAAVASDDRDPAPPMKELEHPRQLRPRAPPNGSLVVARRGVLELPGGERAAALELAQHVPAQG